jgi:hypothetical protein
MGPPPPSYIKYKPRMSPLGMEQNYSKVDYMITEESWNEIKGLIKNVSESNKDLIEEIFDKLEKFT